ncbi:MAG: single-stranded-DNA-specific exonuclease RecJ [Oscillospiraceae bacterium]|nr:single-stranded-DNA-specific exonuclease RecJ [Oscillospiraceae bacterium]
MKSKKWKIPYERPLIPQELLDAGYTPLLCAVLALRGINDAQSAKAMIDGGKDNLCDPMLIMNMDKAAARVKKAIAQKEKVAVYGDYDVDGITATCIVTDYLISKGISCRPYIPDRSEEGYGLNTAAIKALSDEGVSLIITVDCGITAVSETEYARSLNLDLVITDHHECNFESVPDAVAVVDCKQQGDSYPNPYLAGVGMALKLVCACEGESDEMLERYADLVAIGTVADVMPLMGENRYLVKLGLEKLAKSPRPGIEAMLKESSIDADKLSASSIGYSLAPRLNAAGRLGQAVTAAQLLMSTDSSGARALAAELCELNRKRQSIELDIWEEAKSIISSGEKPTAPIVLASEKWHQGVIGIAASRLAEHYSLPAVMICLNGDVGKGSCRSHGGFNLYEALSACSEHLISFGGHALAAGLNIRSDKLDDFRAALEKYYQENRPDTLPEVCCDLLICDPSLLSLDNVRSLDLLEPYGNKNAKPVLCISGARVESLNAVGGGRHLRMKVSLDANYFECIYFSHTAKELGIREGDLVDLAFSPQINTFRGHSSVQLLLSAVRPHDCRFMCRAILEGESGINYAAASYCPSRADFVKVWRSLGKDFHTGCDAEEIIKQCPSRMDAEKFCICLMVLLETGLLKSEDGKIYSAHIAEIGGKADLDATMLIRELKKARR